jgi:K+-sensing histidine kinase KdpD
MKMIVHDLKSPLTAVLATLEMLSDGDFGPLSDTQRQAIGDTEEKSEDLLALIEDILEVARIEEAAISLSYTQIAPAALLAELLHEWSHRFLQESTKASLSVDDDTPLFEADRALLKRVFLESHSERCHALVDADQPAAERPQNSRRSLVHRYRQRPWIPPEYHEVIFRKFGQVGGSQAPRVRSSGLGLTFCKLVVDLHGGMIWVNSREGEGSSFYVQLPLRPAARPEGEAAEPGTADRAETTASSSPHEVSAANTRLSREPVRQRGGARRCCCRREQAK